MIQTAALTPQLAVCKQPDNTVGTLRSFQVRVSVQFGIPLTIDNGWMLLVVIVANDQITALAANFRSNPFA